MTVAELISQLQEHPPTMEVRDAEFCIPINFTRTAKVYRLDSGWFDEESIFGITKPILETKTVLLIG